MPRIFQFKIEILNWHSHFYSGDKTRITYHIDNTSYPVKVELPLINHTLYENNSQSYKLEPRYHKHAHCCHCTQYYNSHFSSDTEEQLIWTMQIAGINVEAHLNKSCTSHCGQDPFSIYHVETSQVHKNLFWDQLEQGFLIQYFNVQTWQTFWHVSIVLIKQGNPVT